MEHYTEEVKKLVLDFVAERATKYHGMSREELAEQLNDDCWCSDTVTGNASGSFFCNASKAREFFYENNGDELFVEMCKEFGIDSETIAAHWGNYEWADVSLRCYVLCGAIEIALDDLEEDGWFE